MLLGGIMEFFNFLVNAIYSFSKYNKLGVISFALSIALIVLIIATFLVVILSKKAVNLKAFKCFTAILLTLITVISAFEFINVKKVFLVVDSVIVYVIALIILCAILFTIIYLTEYSKRLKLTKTKKVSNSVSVNKGSKVTDSEQAPLTNNNDKEVIKLKCVSPQIDGGEFDGYLDVSYLKSLISLLRERNLTEKDDKELEDLEVYLMNFARRQPYKSERSKLTEYLSDLMKKLARYNAV